MSLLRISFQIGFAYDCLVLYRCSQQKHAILYPAFSPLNIILKAFALIAGCHSYF